MDSTTPLNDYSTETARTYDASDPLHEARSLFHIPRNPDGTESVYLCGNSLGLQPITTEAAIRDMLDDWKSHGVEGHFRTQRPWFDYHDLLTQSMADITGALPEEIVCMNSLTVNLHLLMVSFYSPSPERYKILIEEKAFPSDRYAVASQVRFHGYRPDDAIVTIAPREGEDHIRTEDIAALLEREGASIAMILLGGVQYYTGQVFDMNAITERGHRYGCIVGFDLAHAAGNIPLSLHDWDVDFAAWCSYKYLNAGPGSTAGAFVHSRHLHDHTIPRFEGWWGHEKETRFLMEDTFVPSPTAEAWQLSNPAILPLVALRASLDIFDRYGMPSLREKSIRLTGYLSRILKLRYTDRFTIITPDEPEHRGCQISLRVHQNGKVLFDGLTAAGYICDWREPDCIRIAPVPLYNTFEDVYRFTVAFHALLAT